jgi:uncharacterized caspase-like protein
MRHIYRLVVLLGVLAPLLAGPAGAQPQNQQRRFALVIGNSEYKAGRLETAANDAGLVAETLRTAGFDVAGARDLDQDTLHRSIREFVDKVSAAGADAVAFIYFAGYGLQFEGENYILPIDAAIARPEAIPLEAIRISDITLPLAATPGAVKMVVVDAARRHPYTPAGAPLASGLALVEPGPGMLIAFNTAPGAVAPVESGPYGAFAQALAEMIGVGGLGLDDVFSRVRLRVSEKTSGAAVPWYASKITQPFLFTERTPDAPPPPQQVVSAMELQSRSIRQFSGDQEAYIAALERDTIAGYEEFIAAYPDSPHVKRVRALIAVRREALLWRRVLSINTREAYWSYLGRYPQGAHVADCERRLAAMAADYDPPPAFVPMEFDDLPPPPPDEVVYLTQPEIVFEDPVFVPPPPVPDFFCPPPPPEFVVLRPPPRPIGAFFLPAPVVPFFDRPRPWVRPPAFVVVPPRPPVQRITVNNTIIVNESRGARQMSPALPGTVVTRVNSGALHAPPKAPPAPVRPRDVRQSHPGVSVLGTQVALPPRVHAATAPAGHPPPGNPPRPPIPNSATTPSAPHGPAAQGAPHEINQTPPQIARPSRQRQHEFTRPAAPQVTRPSPPPRREFTRPTPLPQVSRPSPPPRREFTRPTPPPQVSRPSPPPRREFTRPTPPPQVSRPSPPPRREFTRPTPPPQVSRPSPPPQHQFMRPPPPTPQIVRQPPPQQARPAAPQRCAVQNGRQVCR